MTWQQTAIWWQQLESFADRYTAAAVRAADAATHAADRIDAANGKQRAALQYQSAQQKLIQDMLSGPAGELLSQYQELIAEANDMSIDPIQRTAARQGADARRRLIMDVGGKQARDIDWQELEAAIREMMGLDTGRAGTAHAGRSGANSVATTSTIAAQTEEVKAAAASEANRTIGALRSVADDIKKEIATHSKATQQKVVDESCTKEKAGGDALRVANLTGLFR